MLSSIYHRIIGAKIKVFHTPINTYLLGHQTENLINNERKAKHTIFNSMLYSIPETHNLKNPTFRKNIKYINSK